MPTKTPLAGSRAATQLALHGWLREVFVQRGQLLPWLVALLMVGGAVQWAGAAYLGQWGEIEILLAGAHVRDAVLRGQWWRLLTWTFLHADAAHLVVNVMMLAVIGRPVEAAFGAARMWLIFWASALAAGIAALGHQGPWWSVGSSGAVFGVLAAFLGLGIKLIPRLGSQLRWRMVGVPALLLALLLSLGSDATDQLAHIGGCLGGLLLGAALHPQFLPVTALAAKQRRASGWLHGLAYATGGVVVAAVVLAAMHLARPLPLATVPTELLQLGDSKVRVPAQLPRGTLSPATRQCVGQWTDPAWALHTRRLACFRLPVEGALILGRRDQQLSLDHDDYVAMARANASGQWVQRQSGVLVYPLGTEFLWVVQAPQPLLATYAAILQPILPDAGTAAVVLPTGVSVADAAGR